MLRWTCSFDNLTAECSFLLCATPIYFWNISSGFEFSPPRLQHAKLTLESMEPMHREQIRHHQFYKDKWKITRSHREHKTVGVTGKTGIDCPILCLYLTIRNVIALMFMWDYCVPLFIKQFKRLPPLFVCLQNNQTTQCLMQGAEIMELNTDRKMT